MEVMEIYITVFVIAIILLTYKVVRDIYESEKELEEHEVTLLGPTYDQCYDAFREFCSDDGKKHHHFKLIKFRQGTELSRAVIQHSNGEVHMYFFRDRNGRIECTEADEESLGCMKDWRR